MGCDIHSRTEIKAEYGWESAMVQFTDDRNYGLFGFLANVRNYSFVPPLSKPKGYPEDYDLENGYPHSASWFTAKELVEFDYAQTFENRRCTRNDDGGADSGIGNGVIVTFKEFLGPQWMLFLKLLTCLDIPLEDIRFVFDFDD